MFKTIGSALDRGCNATFSFIDKAAGYAFIGAGYIVVPVTGAVFGAVDGAFEATAKYHAEVVKSHRVTGGWIVVD